MYLSHNQAAIKEEELQVQWEVYFDYRRVLYRYNELIEESEDGAANYDRYTFGLLREALYDLVHSLRKQLKVTGMNDEYCKILPDVYEIVKDKAVRKWAIEAYQKRQYNKE